MHRSCTGALRLGTAETEAILRRFTRTNVQHPTYKAFAELGKASKTIFLCRYLHSEALRREINEGLNVIEQWNEATGSTRDTDGSSNIGYPRIGPQLTPVRNTAPLWWGAPSPGCPRR